MNYKCIENRAYDVVLSETNDFIILKYVISDEERIDKQGSHRYYRTFRNLMPEMPNDISSRIQELRNEGFIEFNRFQQDMDFDVFSPNPFVDFKINFLKREHKILEKFYQEEVVDNLCLIGTFISYINMISGQVSTLKLRNYGLYSRELEEELEKDGYKCYQNTCIYRLLYSLEQLKR